MFEFTYGDVAGLWTAAMALGALLGAVIATVLSVHYQRVARLAKRRSWNASADEFSRLCETTTLFDKAHNVEASAGYQLWSNTWSGSQDTSK